MRKSNAMRAIHSNQLAGNGTTEKTGDSVKSAASLGEFLSKRKLIASDDYLGVQRAREQVEASGVVALMMETCATINRIAGETIVDMHSFLPPEPILCCFIYGENGTDYFMRLELQGATPTLSFAERKCRDTYSNDFVRWVHRLADIEPVTITVKLEHEFQEVRVSIEQVREWFKYLVSGLDRSYMPTF